MWESWSVALLELCWMQSPKGKENKKVSYEFFPTSQNLSPERGVNPLDKKTKNPPKHSEFKRWNISQGDSVITRNYFPSEPWFLNVSFLFLLRMTIGKSNQAPSTVTFLHARKTNCCRAVLALQMLCAWWNWAGWTQMLLLRAWTRFWRADLNIRTLNLAEAASNFMLDLTL